MKTYKPSTPSQRHLVLINKSCLFKGLPLKSLRIGKLHCRSGRNHYGRITVFHRGGRHARRYRLIDNFRMQLNVPAIIIRVEYDPNRSSFIALIHYLNGLYSYILHTQNLNNGDRVYTGLFPDQSKLFQSGNCSYIGNFPIGSTVHNIESFPNSGFRYIRSAGCNAIVLKKFRAHQILVQLKSGNKKLFPYHSKAVFGSVSNSERRFINYGKAGRVRWLGIRPHVRAYAMNPIDHPMGGRTHGGKQLVTPWGHITKGQSTRKRKKFLIN